MATKDKIQEDQQLLSEAHRKIDEAQNMLRAAQDHFVSILEGLGHQGLLAALSLIGRHKASWLSKSGQDVCDRIGEAS